MKQLLIAILILGLPLFTSSQTPCDKILRSDSSSLRKFSSEFRSAIMTRDMKRIAQFVRFPFCMSCETITGNAKDAQATLISYSQFIASSYKTFFGEWFMETVSKGVVYTLLEPRLIKNNCQFIFSYTISGYDTPSEIKGFFSVEKIEGRYKLTSSWISR